MVETITASEVHARAPSWMATIRHLGSTAFNPFQTDSCRSAPPATSRYGFPGRIRSAISRNAFSRPDRITNTISSIRLLASNRLQVCATRGSPLTSRNSLSVPGPMRRLLPAATMTAEFMLTTRRCAVVPCFPRPVSEAPCGAYSPLTSQPLRYWRRMYWFPSGTLANFNPFASHCIVVFGKRVATLPSRMASVNGPA